LCLENRIFHVFWVWLFTAGHHLKTMDGLVDKNLRRDNPRKDTGALSLADLWKALDILYPQYAYSQYSPL
jgi:hypothetical protein